MGDKEGVCGAQHTAAFLYSVRESSGTFLPLHYFLSIKLEEKIFFYLIQCRQI